jgi:RNA-directed DNA polymerase
VNHKPCLPRETLRRFRATLFQVEKDGPTGKQWSGNMNVFDVHEGYAQFIKMVDAGKGVPLLYRVHAARAKWGRLQAGKVHRRARWNSEFRVLAAQGKAPWNGWWQPVSPPLLEKTAGQVVLKKWLPQSGLSRRPAPPTQRTPCPNLPPASGPRRAVPGGALALQAAGACVAALGSSSALPLVPVFRLITQSALLRSPRWGWYALVMAGWGAGAIILWPRAIRSSRESPRPHRRAGPGADDAIASKAILR